MPFKSLPIFLPSIHFGFPFPPKVDNSDLYYLLFYKSLTQFTLFPIYSKNLFRQQPQPHLEVWSDFLFQILKLPQLAQHHCQNWVSLFQNTAHYSSVYIISSKNKHKYYEYARVSSSLERPAIKQRNLELSLQAF